MNFKIIGIISFVLLLAGLALAVYFGFIRPTTKPNPTQQAEKMYNKTLHYDYHPFIGGCMRFPAEKELNK